MTGASAAHGSALGAAAGDGRPRGLSSAVRADERRHTRRDCPDCMLLSPTSPSNAQVCSDERRRARGGRLGGRLQRRVGWRAARQGCRRQAAPDGAISLHLASSPFISLHLPSSRCRRQDAPGGANSFISLNLCGACTGTDPPDPQPLFRRKGALSALSVGLDVPPLLRGVISPPSPIISLCACI